MEVEQLSSALNSATAFIEDTTEKYSALREQLIESDKIIERLSDDNGLLEKQLEEQRTAAGEIEVTGEESTKYYKDILVSKDAQLAEMHNRLQSMQVEFDELRAKSAFEDTPEREEMEKLRNELVDATNVARKMFSEMSTTTKDNMQVPRAECQRTIAQLNQTVSELRTKISSYEAREEHYVKSMENKDAENLRLNAELKRLRTARFGSADDEISRLEKQLTYREKQIEKLTTKCTLLQVELHGITVGEQNSAINHSSTQSVGNKSESSVISTKNDKVAEPENREEKQTPQMSGTLTEERQGATTDAENGVITKVVKKQHSEDVKKDDMDSALDSWEASALLIASLNHEMMLLLRELDDKNRQLKRMENTCIQVSSKLDSLKTKYMELKQELIESNEQRIDKVDEDLQEKLERYETEIEQHQKFAESIRLSGSDGERRFEEMNRQLIAERLRNLQLAHQLKVTKRHEMEFSEEARKLKKELQEHDLLHDRRMKVASCDADLAAIEIARLQSILLRSVPRREYTEIVEKLKLLLMQDENQTIRFRIEEKDVEFMGINLMKEMADETKIAELIANNEHMKEMLEVVTSQNEYWQKELEKVREQNNELLQFFEDVERESHVKSLLVAVERRFLKALSERAEIAQNESLSSKQNQELYCEYSRKQRNWFEERKKLVNVIRSLQLLIQRVQTNSMEMMTVEQMMDYRMKIGELNESYKKNEDIRNEIERKKEEVDLQLRNAEALRKSHEIMNENGYNFVKLQKNLQANQLNLMTLTNELETTRAQIAKKNMHISALEENITNLKQEIRDLYISSFFIGEVLNEDSDKSIESARKRAVEISLASIATQTDTEQELPDGSFLFGFDAQKDTDRSSKESEQFATTTESTESASVSRTASNVTIRGTGLPPEVLKEYAKKIDHIRETAELCIENYKEQLRHKEEAIEKYKALLKAMQEEKGVPEQYQKVTEPIRTMTGEPKKLKTADEILADVGTSEKDLEIIKLKGDIAHLEAANRRIFEDAEKYRKEAKKYHKSTKSSVNVAVQTSQLLISSASDKAAVKNSPEFSLKSSEDEDVHEDMKSRERNMKVPRPKSARSRSVTQDYTRQEALQEALRGEESKSAQQAVEIRKLKERIQSLTRTNKDLRQACEEIRAEAILQIGQKYEQSSKAANNATVAALEHELTMLKREIFKQKKIVTAQKETIEQLENDQKKADEKSSKEEVARWREKKTREESMDFLKKKLKEYEIREEDLKEKLVKRERRIEQLNKFENRRIAEAERMQKIIDGLKKEKETNDLNEKVTKDQMKTSMATIAYLNQRIVNMRKENEELQKSLKEKEFAYETLQKEKKVLQQNGDISVDTVYDRKVKDDEYEYAIRRLTLLEKENLEYFEEIKRLKATRCDCGAVSLLRDKLVAKDKFIEQQLQRIEELERERWQQVTNG